MACIKITEQEDYGIEEVQKVLKRYWLVTLLAVFGVGGLCTFYVYESVARLPEYKLTTIEGDPGEAMDVELSGWYGGVLFSDNLTVSTEGSHYQRDKSFYERNIGGNGSSEYERLKKEHRSFMRGKDYMDNFYKDREWLIYAEMILKTENNHIQESVLKLDILNEITGKVAQYRTKIEGKENFYWVTISDIQRVGDEIHILTYQHPYPQYTTSETASSVRTSDEYHLYVVDLNNGDILREGEINHGINLGAGEELILDSIANEIRSAPAEHVVLRVRKEMRDEESTGGYQVKSYIENLISYSYQSGRLTPLVESRKQSNPTNVKPDFYTLNGNILTVAGYHSTKLEVSRYDVSSGQQLAEILALTAEQLDVDKISQLTVRQDKIYTLAHKKGSAILIILDGTNGTILYKGQAVYAGPESKADEQQKNLRLLNIEVKA